MSMKTKQSSRAMLITLVWHGHTSGSIFVSWIIFAQKCSLIVNLYEKASGLRRALPCWRWKLGLNKEIFLFFMFCHAFLWFPGSCWFYIPLDEYHCFDLFRSFTMFFFFIYLTGFIPCEQSEGPSSIFYSSWQKKMAEYYFLLIIYFM